MNLRSLAFWVVLFPAIACAQVANTSPCGAGAVKHDLTWNVKSLWHGVETAPRNAVRPRNLAWELPIAATAGILIGAVDRPASNRIQSVSLQNDSGRWSNIGLGIELGSAGLAWSAGCLSHRSRIAETGFTALTAAGAALAIDLGLKAAFNRQYPSTPNTRGEFWEGGKSFPSGHSATSFGFAAAVAHRTHSPWVKWGAYALASGVSLSRFPAKKHFPSDILVGATLGYVTGTYLAEHPPQ